MFEDGVRYHQIRRPGLKGKIMGRVNYSGLVQGWILPHNRINVDTDYALHFASKIAEAPAVRRPVTLGPFASTSTKVDDCEVGRQEGINTRIKFNVPVVAGKSARNHFGIHFSP